MMRKTVSQRKLTRLALVTAITLIGIVGLQVFWLCTSWVQQRNRFRADVTNVVNDVSMYGSMNDIRLESGVNNTTSVVINLTNTNKSANAHKPRIEITSDDDNANSKFPAGTIFISANKDDSLPITQARIDALMDSAKAKMLSELSRRDIHVPFEIVIINDKGAIVKATCDTARFRHISLKPGARVLVANHNKPRLLLQAAFPDANLYLLRRMAAVLSVTVLLIIICAWSFSYMLIHFFQQKKMADIRNDFMNNMTHELKTPIAAALVAVELAEGRKHTITETEKAEYLSVARSEMQRLTGQLDKILKMAAFDQNQIPLNKSTSPVYDMVNEAVRNMDTISHSAGAEIKVIAPNTAVPVFADKVQIVHALQNLLENAIKYNDKPAPVITFEISEVVGGAIIRVRDNGKGIPSAYISRVFDKFFRVPSGDIHDVKGYGLGLSYVKSIVDLHDGTITVNSKEKEGTTFTLFLPSK